MAKTSGNFKALAKHGMVTWKGWAIYHWDMSYSLMLFHEKPKELWYGEGEDREMDGWDTKDANENVSPFFLKACGIDVPFDGVDDAGREFYYGEGCYGGHRPPIQIELTLPGPLMDQLGLT